MEALQKTNATHRGDTSPDRKLLDKELRKFGAQQEDSNYVDLDDLLAMKTEGTKTVKVTFTGEASQLAIFKSSSEAPVAARREREESARSACTAAKDCQANIEEPLSSETASSPEVPDSSDDFGDCVPSPDARGDKITERHQGIFPPNYNPKNVSFESEELHYTDMYLNSKSESEDSASVVLSDSRTPSTTEDESHYITTHEIQLLELDHDVDHDFGQGSRWDIEDDNLVYSFVDYASFDSDETIEEVQVLEDISVAKVPSQPVQSKNDNSMMCAPGDDAVKHDLCDSEKFGSSDESLLKNPNSSGNAVGQIHLSIKATSRAINEQRNIPEKENLNGYIFKSPNAKVEAICDRASCFIPAPGRVHIGSKLKGKDINEYSSGASSSISELDDADKEVRNLTTRAFRSLACPYFNAINFSTSSESSASEHGLGVNRWSAFVDLKYGNMTQGREQNLISHKSSTSTFELNKSTEGKGMNAVALANLKTPETKIFALNNNLPNPHNAQSSSTKKIELKGKLSQGQCGVITLTETLNFRCNVQAGVSSSEKCAKLAENVVVSHSTDEVTGTTQSEPGTEESHQLCDAGETTEDTHKKSIFASSLLKNVISKKMQFEQERKMERGEIQDTYPVVSPCNPCKDHETHKEKTKAGNSRDLQRENSKFSETGSGFSIVSLDELGDIIESNSYELKDESQKGETSLSPEANLEHRNEGLDSKKGTTEGTKSTLHRSQNSAFRSWREDELECQKELENFKTPTTNPPFFTVDMRKTSLDVEAGSRKPTKMSHLFVPSIQLPSKDWELGKPSNKNSVSTVSYQEQVNDSINICDTKSAPASRSPEIKISLRSVKDNKHNPFSIANLLTPNIGSSAAMATKPADDSNCQTLVTSLKAESTEKVPSFTVRDIRDNKWRLQPPIYQVRDVRKLVKSSYHFVSLDNQENKADSQVQHNTCKQGPLKNKQTPLPIVIKCQSVNTNSNLKQSGNRPEIAKRRLTDVGASYQIRMEGTKNGTIPVNRTTGRVPLATTKQYKSDQSDMTGGVKKDKVIDVGERKPESKMTNQAAIEKLKAAVKTMEQLYVFDRNEWKRKTQAPWPVTDSHVLSLITSEEQVNAGKVESEGETGNPASSEKSVQMNSCHSVNKSPATLPAIPALEVSQKKEKKGSLKMVHIPFKEEKHFPKPQSHQSGSFGNKDTFSLGSKSRATATIGGSSNKVPTLKAQSSTKSFLSKASKVPVSLKTSQSKHAPEESKKLNASEADQPLPPQLSKFDPLESENYLTIPVKTCSAETNKDPIAICSAMSTTARLQDQSPDSHSNQGDAKRHSVQLGKKPAIMETQSPDSPTATIYHHSLPMAAQGAQPQIFCFSPSVPPVATSSLDTFQQTQRKMLLDPTTGHYYLVETPVHPATRRLFDPETGQYVDVPMPQQCVTPVPMPVSPLALSPGTYGPTYIYYPGFAPSSATVTTGTDGGGEKSSSREATPGGQQAEAPCWETPYYSHTGQPTQGQLVPQFVTSRVCQDSSSGKPVISITSQQGPRIIAPPSFDGTTMSFVVEHR